MKTEKKKRLILLDIDDTLFRCDTFVAFIAYYLSTHIHKLILLPWLLLLAVLFKAGAVSNVTLKENALLLFKGEDRASLAACAKRLADRLFAKKLNRAVFEAVKSMAATGLYEIIVISASPSFYIEMIGGRIGAALTLATDIRFDENGRLTASLAGANCKGEEKIVRLRREINPDDYDLERSYAFSDSITDLPMFELLGRPVAVTPDKRLREHAVKNNYIIIN
jgi:HAD superfamily hydrolase (TIGR01490 family)